MGAENLEPPPTGIRSPDRPARCKSLYPLNYRGPLHALYMHITVTYLQTQAPTAHVLYVPWVLEDCFRPRLYLRSEGEF